MRSILLILFCFPIVLLSQNKSVFFIEGGTCFNTATNRSFHVKDPGGSTSSFEYEGTISSKPSYYIKGGLEKQFSLCAKSSLSFPVSINYFNEAQKIKAIGGWSGCMGGESGHYTFNRNNHTAGLSLGLKFIYNLSEKLSLQNGINFNPTILAYREDNIKVVNESGTTGYYAGYGLGKICISLSAQTGLFYTIHPSTKLGLTTEYFFYTKHILPKDDYRFQDMFDFEFGYKGYSAMLNFGLRLQHSF
ncbi:MAG: hypothetical protein KA163_08050 [Bacteroidia bacterium]|nr:hypothetical protein [Bacteroidia bacterium]